MEQELVQVTFRFKDGSTLTLQGPELHSWETICYLKSDYLLPGSSDHVLAQIGYGVAGFVPPSAVKVEAQP